MKEMTRSSKRQEIIENSHLGYRKCFWLCLITVWVRFQFSHFPDGSMTFSWLYFIELLVIIILLFAIWSVEQTAALSPQVLNVKKVVTGRHSTLICWRAQLKCILSGIRRMVYYSWLWLLVNSCWYCLEILSFISDSFFFFLPHSLVFFFLSVEAVEVTILTCRINNKNNTYRFNIPSLCPSGRQKIKWAVTQYWACNIHLKQASVYKHKYTHSLGQQPITVQRMDLATGMPQCPYNLASSRSIAFYTNEYLLTANEYCDEEIWDPNTFAELWGKEVRLSGCQWTIVVSKNYRMVVVGEAVSPPPSLLLQGDMGMGGPISISHVCISGEANLWLCLVLRKKQKKPTRGEFSNYGHQLVAVYSSQGEDA